MARVHSSRSARKEPSAARGVAASASAASTDPNSLPTMNSSFGGSARCVDLASCVDPRAVECPGMVDTDAPPPVDTSVADLCVSVSPSPSSLSLSTTVPSSRARGVTVRWMPRPVGVVGSRPSGEGCVGVVSPTSMRPDGDVIMLGDVPRAREAAAASGCCCCCSWGGSVKDGWTFRGVMPGIPVPGGAFSSGDRGDDSSISVVRGLSEGVAGGSCSSPSPASSPIAASLSLNLVSCSSAARSSMVASRFASGERSSRNEYTPRPGLIPRPRGFRLVAEPASDASLDGVSMGQLRQSI